jgi:catechol 2,3-dioxygenase-like lactoylglutathione lyase family enzyme
MKLSHLDHVVLTITDPEATVAFYSRLGMQPESFGNGRLALHFGRQKINLHQVGAEIEPHADTPVAGSADICLLIEGAIEEVQAELNDLGVPIELGPVNRIGAEGPICSLYLRDPDGNLVELSEPANQRSRASVRVPGWG